MALFLGQPLHGPATAVASSGAPAAAGLRADSGPANVGAHDEHLCPLCRAAGQARFALEATPHAVVLAQEFRSFAFHPAPEGVASHFDLGASAPRAPPLSLSSLV